MVQYDWHEGKRQGNIEKHGIDFLRAALVYESPLKATLCRECETETRFVDIAPVENRLMVLVYAKRDNIVWVISYRKAKVPKEEHIYYLTRLEK